ncbi:MAG: biopolymer transport protein ExbD [Verrucomicrobia bacterium]|jgi:biopolymer transport protein ExbD|nr:MAG: biopolymer transport protein ExbD [Verrucomicrobiota bacterium]
MSRKTNNVLDASFGSLAELNVTPLLDLAFVLLIIFMMTAPFLAESADLTIPTSKASRDAIDPSQVHVISVNRDRQMFLGEEEMTPAVLRAALMRLHAKDPQSALVIRADRQLLVEDLVAVMDLAKEVNITKVGVITKPEE